MFRISSLLWLILLIGINAAALVKFEFFIQRGTLVLLVGLMPLFDLVVISLYVALTRSFRFRLIRREEPRSLSSCVAATSGAFLAVAMVLCFLFPEHILELLETLILPAESWSYKLAFRPREAFIGAMLAIAMSGVPFCLSLIIGYIASRYDPVITPRTPASSDDLQS